MKYLLFTTILMLAMLSTHDAQAQFTGPSSFRTATTVSEVIEDARRLDRQDALVKLRGFVVEQINEDEFWFEDATGRVRLEIEPQYMPSAPFDHTTELVIMAEVDFDLLDGTEIEAKRILFAAEYDALSEDQR